MNPKIRHIYDRDKQKILEFLKTHGASRPFRVGLACQPSTNKEGAHRQWANRWLLRLQREDVVESFLQYDYETGKESQTFYRLKDGQTN